MKTKLSKNSTINERIEFIRTSLGYPESPFARKLGTMRSSITRVVKAGEDPSFALVKNILKIFPVNPEWLYMGVGPAFTTDDVSEFVYEPDTKTESNIDADVNARLKQLRLELGLSQVVFASEVRATRDTISFIEGNRTAPSTPLLKRIVRKYKLNWLWLMEGKGPQYRVTKAA